MFCESVKWKRVHRLRGDQADSVLYCDTHTPAERVGWLWLVPNYLQPCKHSLRWQVSVKAAEIRLSFLIPHKTITHNATQLSQRFSCVMASTIASSRAEEQATEFDFQSWCLDVHDQCWHLRQSFPRCSERLLQKPHAFPSYFVTLLNPNFSQEPIEC